MRFSEVSVDRPPRIQRPINWIVGGAFLAGGAFGLAGLRLFSLGFWHRFAGRFGFFRNLYERTFEPAQRCGFAGADENLGFGTLDTENVRARR